MIKSLKNNILVLIVLFICTYLLTSFAELSFLPQNWGQESRVGTAIIPGVFTLTRMLIQALDKAY